MSGLQARWRSVSRLDHQRADILVTRSVASALADGGAARRSLSCGWLLCGGSPAQRHKLG